MVFGEFVSQWRLPEKLDCPLEIRAGWCELTGAKLSRGGARTDGEGPVTNVPPGSLCDNWKLARHEVPGLILKSEPSRRDEGSPASFQDAKICFV